MFISHESGHCQKEKLVVSPAFNQVVQSLFDRLLRLSYSSPHGSINQSSPRLPGPISSSQDRIRVSSYGLCRCPPIHPLQLARRILLHPGRFPQNRAPEFIEPRGDSTQQREGPTERYRAGGGARGTVLAAGRWGETCGR